jgi:hypothetical protein
VNPMASESLGGAWITRFCWALGHPDLKDSRNPLPAWLWKLSVSWFIHLILTTHNHPPSSDGNTEVQTVMRADRIRTQLCMLAAS